MSDTFVLGLPKAELHVHLEGTLEPQLMLALAKRNGVELPWQSADQLRAAYQFNGLEHFLSLYFQGCRVLRQRQDFYDLTTAYLHRAAEQGVLRAEMFFGPQTFLDVGVPIGDQLDPILTAIADARSSWGIEGALLVSAHRHRSQAEALELLELVQPWSQSIAGFGLGGAERANPPVKFAQYFTVCRDRGFATSCHAGEDGPSSYVAQAIEVCQVDRVDHGIAAARDPALLGQLRDRGIALTICPLSNVKLGVVSDLRQHPLPTFIRAGVRVCINSDDPPYFGGYIAENYCAVAQALGFGRDELAELARNSFRASFASPELIARGITLIDDYQRQQQMAWVNQRCAGKLGRPSDC